MAARVNAGSCVQGAGAYAPTTPGSKPDADEGWQVVTRKRKKEKPAANPEPSKASVAHPNKAAHAESGRMALTAHENLTRGTQKNLRDLDCFIRRGPHHDSMREANTQGKQEAEVGKSPNINSVAEFPSLPPSQFSMRHTAITHQRTRHERVEPARAARFNQRDDRYSSETHTPKLPIDRVRPSPYLSAAPDTESMVDRDEQLRQLRETLLRQGRLGRFFSTGSVQGQAFS